MKTSLDCDIEWASPWRRENIGQLLASIEALHRIRHWWRETATELANAQDVPPSLADAVMQHSTKPANMIGIAHCWLSSALNYEIEDRNLLTGRRAEDCEFYEQFFRDASVLKMRIDALRLNRTAGRRATN